jgi:hypothetical protein
MVNVRFPTCWDGVNLDAPDHMGHVAYPGMCSNLIIVERVLVSTCLFMYTCYDFLEPYGVYGYEELMICV